jgi:hypothetical protein
MNLSIELMLDALAYHLSLGEECAFVFFTRGNHGGFVKAAMAREIIGRTFLQNYAGIPECDNIVLCVYPEKYEKNHP